MANLDGIRVSGPPTPATDAILTPDALEFVAALHRRFNPVREALLARRRETQRRLDEGWLPDFDPETASVREGSWTIAPVPADLLDRRVEITGPTDRKMVINALNSGARMFMADFEDANSPTWPNMVEGQQNLIDAIERRITFTSPDGRLYQLNDRVATLLVRPRGWHLVERHLLVDGQPVSASLFDFGLYVFHNARRLLDKGSGPYFYLPKLEHYLEARLWNDVFSAAEDLLGIPRGSIRATVLIETILAALQMDEILYELREHAAGLNAGRWDYIFSVIKKFGTRPEFLLPDRAQVTMTVPFMRAYTTLLVETCHRRGAHAIGGMAAFIPSRRDPAVNERALAAVRDDKLREAHDGFDGTWVAHPDLVPVATAVFDEVLGSRPNQLEKRPDRTPAARELLDVRVPGGQVTEAGLRNNVSVALQYLEAWLGGQGAVGIFNLMEDAATAEISRSQLWQWIRHGVALPDGRTVTRELVRQIVDEELAKLPGATDPARRFADARRLLETVSLGDTFVEFLTLPAYDMLAD
ncbi:MAG: malate synthase A [Actinomycetia bacterium]|nr:malate synthase A [Actinomycetes bacterium]